MYCKTWSLRWDAMGYSQGEVRSITEGELIVGTINYIVQCNIGEKNIVLLFIGKKITIYYQHNIEHP